MLDYNKSKELVYVINRLAINVNYLSLRNKLESWSLKLLEELALEDLKKSAKIVMVIKSLIEFGRGIYEIEPINADLVGQELDRLNAAIRQNNQLPHLPDFFNDREGEKNDDGLESTIRQSAILEKIRQIPNCQLRDLMSSFDEVSERTLRYDLQKLFNQGLLERIGAGPSTCYVIKQLLIRYNKGTGEIH